MIFDFTLLGDFTLPELQTELLEVLQHREEGSRMVLAFSDCWGGLRPLLETVLLLFEVKEAQGLGPAGLKDGTSSSVVPSSADRSRSVRPRYVRPQSSPGGRSSPFVWQDLCEGPQPGDQKGSERSDLILQ